MTTFLIVLIAIIFTLMSAYPLMVTGEMENTIVVEK